MNIPELLQNVAEVSNSIQTITYDAFNLELAIWVETFDYQSILRLLKILNFLFVMLMTTKFGVILGLVVVMTLEIRKYYLGIDAEWDEFNKEI